MEQPRSWDDALRPALRTLCRPRQGAFAIPLTTPGHLRNSVALRNGQAETAAVRRRTVVSIPPSDGHRLSPEHVVRSRQAAPGPNSERTEAAHPSRRANGRGRSPGRPSSPCTRNYNLRSPVAPTQRRFSRHEPTQRMTPLRRILKVLQRAPRRKAVFSGRTPAVLVL